jgi:hypothetical protein
MASEPGDAQYTADITEAIKQMTAGDIKQGPPDTTNFSQQDILQGFENGQAGASRTADLASLQGHPKTPEAGGPILTPLKDTGHDLKEAGAGIFGTVERWSKAAWEGIKHAWHFMQEHVPSWFSTHHLFTAGWIGLAAGAGVFGIAKGADVWRKRRARKKQEAQGH